MNAINSGRGGFAVLNPWGRDPEIIYPGGPSSPLDDAHPPVNYHAYAACMRGGWYRDCKRIPDETSVVLVLLRPRGLRDAALAIRLLKQRGKNCWISWKESGLHQVAEALNSPTRYSLFVEICAQAEGFIASTPEVAPIYQSSGAKRGAFIPTPYPLEYPSWDLSIPFNRRSGIFVGTREFDVPSRNHLAAVLAACRVAKNHHTHVSVTSTSRQSRRMLEAIDRQSNLRIVDGPIPYADYVRLMASHKAVFQLDSSCVPGQVAGDALLARIPCIGGNGAVDRLSRFPAPAEEPPAATLDRILRRPSDLAEGFAATWEKASELLSYQTGAARIAKLCLSSNDGRVESPDGSEVMEEQG